MVAGWLSCWVAELLGCWVAPSNPVTEQPSNSGSQSKIHRNGVIHIDRLAAKCRRSEAPLAHRFARSFSESVRQGLDHPDIVDCAVPPPDPPHHHRPLHPRPPRRPPITRQNTAAL